MRSIPALSKLSKSLLQYEKLKEIFTHAIELSGDERLQYLASATQGDEEMLTAVQGLLEESQGSGDFLLTPLPDQIPLPPEEDPRLGGTVGAYKIKRLVARGAFSNIYEAARADGMFERNVALKLASNSLGSGSITARLAREIELLGRLEHRFICRLIDAGSDSRDLFAVLEYASAGRLLDYASTHGVDTSHRLELFLQLCDAVQFLHINGHFHGDLKPANVLVRRDKSICLIDFGSARRINESQRDIALNDDTRPALTVAYANPEVLSGAEKPLKPRQCVGLYEENGFSRLVNALRARCKQVP